MSAVERPILCIAVTPALQRTMEFPRLVVGGVNRARAMSVSAAGKAVNVAQVLHTLGSRVVLTGFQGGTTGRMMQLFLGEKGLAMDFVQTGQATRICTTLLDGETGVATELVEESSAPTAEEWRLLEAKVERLSADSAFVVASGALPPGAPEAAYARLLGFARQAGVNALIDSKGAPMMHALSQQPLLAKMNRDELAETVNGSTRTKDAMRSAIKGLAAKGAAWVLVTDGAKEAVLFGDGAFHVIKPPVVAAVNTVGCGDAVGAGVAHALCRGDDMLRAVTFGIACGSAKAMSRTPSDLTVADAMTLVGKVVVQGG